MARARKTEKRTQYYFQGKGRASKDCVWKTNRWTEKLKGYFQAKSYSSGRLKDQATKWSCTIAKEVRK